MKCRVVYLPEAEIDSTIIHLNLRQFLGKAAARFRGSMRRKLSAVKENPQIYERYRYRPQYRCLPLEKYLLFYEVDEKQKIVYIFRILHGAQDVASYL